MAKGRKTGGRDFPPGVSGNPKGCPPLPAELKHARRLSKLEFEAIVNKYLWLSAEELAVRKKDGGLPAIDHLIVATLLKGITTGDFAPTEWILQRLVGKVKDQLEVAAKPYIVRHLDGTQTVLGAKGEEEGE